MYLGTPQGGEGLSQKRPNISLEVPRLQPLSSNPAPDLFPSLIPWGTPPRPRVAQPLPPPRVSCQPWGLLWVQSPGWVPEHPRRAVA